MRTPKCLIPTAVILLVTNSVMANPEMDRLESMHRKMDTSHDGIVSHQEFLNYWESRFDRHDKDKDGAITKSENGFAGLQVADTNGDGEILLEEAMRLRQDFFNRMDRNGNQQLTLKEIRGAAVKPKDAPQAPPVPVDFSALRATVEALSSLTEPPKMWLAEDFESTDSLAAIYFDALDYQGKPTKVFAWLGLPDSSADAKVPGVVLVHGGGGTAFKEWVELWTDRGYAAISIAVEGQTDRKIDGAWEAHEWAGPKRSGIYNDSSEPLVDQWMYHAVADTILANSLLGSLPEVDAEKVGIMGISWGGVIASTVIGIDDRFAFAIPTYGCGDLSTAGNQYGRSLGKNELYRQVWDPILRLEKTKVPTLWYSWPSDEHFPLDLQANCYAAQSGYKMVSLVPKMGHGHGSAWNRPESYAFADSVLAFPAPWCFQKSAKQRGNSYEVMFRSTQPLDSAELVSTTDDGITGSRTWVQAPLSKPVAEGLKWKVKAHIPKGSTAWFINVKSGGLVVSSELAEL